MRGVLVHVQKMVAKQSICQVDNTEPAKRLACKHRCDNTLHCYLNKQTEQSSGSRITIYKNYVRTVDLLYLPRNYKQRHQQ